MQLHPMRSFWWATQLQWRPFRVVNEPMGGSRMDEVVFWYGHSFLERWLIQFFFLFLLFKMYIDEWERSFEWNVPNQYESMTIGQFWCVFRRVWDHETMNPWGVMEKKGWVPRLIFWPPKNEPHVHKNGAFEAQVSWLKMLKNNFVAPENGGFQYESPSPGVYFQGLCWKTTEVSTFSRIWSPHGRFDISQVPRWNAKWGDEWSMVFVHFDV